MGFKKTKLKAESNINLTSMIDVTSFILLALAILNISMKKEASLDNLLKLPPVYNASKQDKSQLQIYIMPASILPGGYINPDSTGLVAFVGKGKAPDKCPQCGLQLRNEKGEYLAHSLLDRFKKPIPSMEPSSSAEDQDKVLNELPPAYWCSKCNFEISPYLKLEQIPQALHDKKKEVVDIEVKARNYSRLKNNLQPLTEKEIKDSIADDIPLMIKADNQAFYGRILQVVNMAKDTLCDIKKFAFVTLASASKEAQKKPDEKKKK